MSQFTDTQAAYKKANEDKHASRKAVFLTKQKIVAAQRQKDQLSRVSNDGNQEALARVSRQIDTLSRDLSDQQLLAASHVGVLNAQTTDFSRFSDPQTHISELSNHFPILMLPLRIETRFKSVSTGEMPGTELWVRAYPDDIAIDTFEHVPAQVEVDNTRAYWTNVWLAGGDESLKRAAWASLARSHGAGRAHWLLNLISPINRAQEPIRGDDEFLLVIVSDSDITESEKVAIATYWKSIDSHQPVPIDPTVAMQSLTAATSASRAEELLSNYAPHAVQTNPQSVITITTVIVAFIEFATDETLDKQQQPWMNPARTRVMPDRLVVLGFNSGKQTLTHLGNPIPSELTVGPNPSALGEDQIRVEDDELIINAELRWTTDFDEAVAKGMGFRIPLTADQARIGFDRLFVVGVRLSETIESSRELLETLIHDHQRSRKGFALLPQGAPTNNVEDEQAGYTWLDDDDQAYDHFFIEQNNPDPIDWRSKTDGRWLAEALGIDAQVLKASPYYFGTDQADMRAMNEALFPATLGYFCEQMLDTVFDESTIKQTREYFNRFVHGRGAVPVIRVGKQPYGILPCTVFSRIGRLQPRRDDNILPLGGDTKEQAYLEKLYRVTRVATTQWQQLIDNVSYIGKPDADQHQQLLDVVGLHPGSVEFYQRYAESAEQIVNRFKLSPLLGPLLSALIVGGYVISGKTLLNELGHEAPKSGEVPQILNKFFFKDPNLLKGALVDDVRVSEVDPLRAYQDDGTNYIEWLAHAAQVSHDELRQQRGFVDNKRPNALLYLFLHHALDLTFVSEGIDLHAQAGLLTAQQVISARKEPKFIHIEQSDSDKGSPWQYLYKADAALTENIPVTVGEYLAQTIFTRSTYLQSQINAIERLKGLPTARLERGFTEHLDCCSYRLDAWTLGLVNKQLEQLRSGIDLPGTDINTTRGSYLGAFGWLEDLRPRNSEFSIAELSESMSSVFEKPGQPPIEVDSNNFGHIFAPSLNHAVTAAVLRNGYLANATPENPESLSINLTSARVRQALELIEGIRNGQSMSELLGYRFERGLRDEPGLILDTIIFEMRQRFPLRGNRMASTRPDPQVSIKFQEARNVVDGLELVEHVQRQTGSDTSYPFGLGSLLPSLSDPEREAVDRHVEHIASLSDAVADLGMAEGVYQVVQGNYDRTAGTLTAFSKGHFPPTPEVVRTPRTGINITHRVAMHFRAELDPNDPAFSTPRAKGEPAINAWLEHALPTMDKIVGRATYFNHAIGADETITFSAQTLGLLPVDLLYLLNADGLQQATSLDDRIIAHATTLPGYRPDSPVSIQYRYKEAGVVSFFEVAPLVSGLRGLLLRSRPLRATDSQLPNEASNTSDAGAQIRTEKIDAVRNIFSTALVDLEVLEGQIDTFLDVVDDATAINNAVNNIDTVIADSIPLMLRINLFGVQGTGLGKLWTWRERAYAALVGMITETDSRWDVKLNDFDARVVEYAAFDPALSSEERIAFLLQTALLISAQSIEPPASGNPSELLTTLTGIVRPAFVAVHTELRGLTTTHAGVGGLLVGLRTLSASIAIHDLQAIDLDSHSLSVRSFLDDNHAQVSALVSDLKRRLAASDLARSDAPTDNPVAAIDALTIAIRHLTTQEFRILPEFSISSDQNTEFGLAVAQSDSLLNYLRDTQNVDFPVDDWLYGIARVREKMGIYERVQIHTESLKGVSLALTPTQFPHRSDDHWLAMQYPIKDLVTGEPTAIDEDKVLYTAYHQEPFDTTRPVHCGVLLDEWTETLPTVEETAGLAFHFDRPNNEAPQSLLLALPANPTGQWQWQDLVDTLHETLDLAKQRAVEPQHIDQTSYARFLPATVSAVTHSPIMQMLNLAENNFASVSRR